MIGERYTLAPSRIVDKARQLASNGLFKQALELLERNKVVFEVLPTEVKVSLPRPPAHNYTFKKGNRYGKPPERSYAFKRGNKHGQNKQAQGKN